VITRFAPSPTGPLHLGHAFSALIAHDLALKHGGTFLLRIEDIDASRARPEWEAQIYDDLRWLGLTWPEPVMRQSERQSAYNAALDQLWDSALLFPCTCNRKDIAAAASAPQEGAQMGPDGIIYPGTCRNRRRDGLRQFDTVMRLDMEKAAPELANSVGDVVLARRGMGTSYHLSVVVDDAAQGVTDVVRGQDLVLNLPTPTYHHHRLIRDDKGKRLAKRDDARALSKYRSEGASPHDIRRLVGLPQA